MALPADLQLQLFCTVRLDVLSRLPCRDWRTIAQKRCGLVATTCAAALRACSYAGQVGLVSLHYLTGSTVWILACRSNDLSLLTKLLNSFDVDIAPEQHLPLLATLQHVEQTANYQLLNAYLAKFTPRNFSRLFHLVIHDVIKLGEASATILLTYLGSIKRMSMEDENARYFLRGYLGEELGTTEDYVRKNAYVRGLLTARRFVAPQSLIEDAGIFDHSIATCPVELLGDAERNALYYFAPNTLCSIITLTPATPRRLPRFPQLSGILIPKVLQKRAQELLPLLREHYRSSPNLSDYVLVLRALLAEVLTEPEQQELCELSPMLALIAGYATSIDEDELPRTLESCLRFATLQLIPNFPALLQTWRHSATLRPYLFESAALVGQIQQLYLE